MTQSSTRFRPPCPSVADVQPATIDDLLDLAALVPDAPLRLVGRHPFAADDTSDAALEYRARLPLAERVEAVRAAAEDLPGVGLSRSSHVDRYAALAAHADLGLADDAGKVGR